MSNNIDLVLTSLRRIIRAADIQSKKLTKTAGLTAPQLLLMQAIANNSDNTTPSNMAKQISLSQATVTSIIQRLEARQLITRVRSKTDKRYVWLHLTDKGQTLLDAAPTPLQENFIRKF